MASGYGVCTVSVVGFMTVALGRYLLFVFEPFGTRSGEDSCESLKIQTASGPCFRNPSRVNSELGYLSCASVIMASRGNDRSVIMVFATE